MFFFFLDQYIGNMVKANVIFGMQDYLGQALTRCNTSSKVGNIPLSVCVFTLKCFIGQIIETILFYSSKIQFMVRKIQLSFITHQPQYCVCKFDEYSECLYS